MGWDEVGMIAVMSLCVRCFVKGMVKVLEGYWGLVGWVDFTILGL